MNQETGLWISTCKTLVYDFPCVTDVACILMLMKTLDGVIIMSSGKQLKLKGNAILLTFCFA